MPTRPDIDVIAPNFKKRMSGVTSTVVRLVPLQAQSIKIAGCGPRLPKGFPQISFKDVVFMSRQGPSGPRVWHARRNSEMLPGILLKTLLRKKLKLLFTSAAQRDHSGYTKWLLRQMDFVIATSAKSARYLKVPSRVIHHGIDTEVFKPAENKTALRASLNLPKTGRLIGCFGRIRPQKGNDVFVDAMLQVLPNHPDAYAIVMGGVADKDQPFLQTLKDKAKAAGLSNQILFFPEAPDFQITEYFQALDLYVAPQRWEGFGLTPIEAMACGAPVVATRVGAFEDQIEDGVNGALVDVEDVDAIAQNVDRLLSDDVLRDAWSASARARVEQAFDLRREADAINAVYETLIASKT